MEHVVIVGAGFGGLAAARALAGQAVRVTVIDRTNHHLFQPLLYQVATAMLMPGQIAAPVREIVRGDERTEVVLGEVTGVDWGSKTVRYVAGEGREAELGYDWLVLATGVRHSYFGNDRFAEYAPGMKTMPDATAVRDRILRAFEEAENEPDERRRRALLTFVMVGGGPTGVEMAGATAELARLTMRDDFRRIDPREARVILVEAGPRVLGSFSEGLSRSVERRLRRMGVEVRTGKAVEEIDGAGVVVAGERIESRNVIWTAGVAPSPAAVWLGLAPGKVRVRRDLTVAERDGVLVIGDAAYFEQGGRPLPGVAQVAMQMGRHVARVIEARRAGRGSPGFRYVNKGDMAVVGRNFAIFERGRVRFAGRVAWWLWSMIHMVSLALPTMRASVMLQWAWSYATGSRGSRLIMGTKFPQS